MQFACTTKAHFLLSDYAGLSLSKFYRKGAVFTLVGNEGRKQKELIFRFIRLVSRWEIFEEVIG